MASITIFSLIVLNLFLISWCAGSSAHASSGSEAVSQDPSAHHMKCHKGKLTCGDNEIVDDCPADCASDYCPKSECEISRTCSKPDPCPPAKCKCRINHRRAENGTCIPTRNCPPFDCQNPNEEFNSCPPLCPTDDCSQASPDGKCPKRFGRIGTLLICQPKCRCIKGYWRKDGICVPYGECPGVCPNNERYSSCLQGECRALNCTQKGRPIACPRIDPQYCQTGCVCQEGYLRDATGKCVAEDECKSVCPANERYSECTQAECIALKCSQKDKPVGCASIAEGSCETGCVCEDGYLRGEDGTCIPEEQCNGVCPANERYSKCIQGECRALKCSQKDKPIACPSIEEGSCESGCLCQDGYLRFDNGTCVPEDQCNTSTPLTCGENQESKCVNDCPPETTCRSRNVAIDCLADEKPCQQKCVCKEGYYRNAVGDCITSEQCGVCPANERYSKCIQGECIALKCSQKDKPIACPSIEEGSCESGCLCQDGYLRFDNGTCVPEDQCNTSTPLTCGENQESKCVNECPPETTCRSRNVAIDCLADEKPCQQKCVCKEGYYRNAVGDCITSEQCDQCTGDHEYFACGVECDNVCTELYKQSKDNCPFVNIQCNKKCYCEGGYARDGNGTCVAIKDCPTNPKCRDGEVVDICPVDCPSDYCPTSEEQAKTKRCPKPEVCPPATCKCGFNSRQADDGTCIATRDCPPLDCSGSPNQHYDSCPPLCPGEQCGSATADGKCHLPGRIGIVQTCNPACRCDTGYARRDGVCVPFDDCKNCPGPNEVYTDEKISCPPNSCKSIVAKYKCAENQTPISGCLCADGYLRNDNGTCVRTCQCPEMRNSPDCQQANAP